MATVFLLKVGFADTSSSSPLECSSCCSRPTCQEPRPGSMLKTSWLGEWKAENAQAGSGGSAARPTESTLGLEFSIE